MPNILLIDKNIAKTYLAGIVYNNNNKSNGNNNNKIIATRLKRTESVKHKVTVHRTAKVKNKTSQRVQYQFVIFDLANNDL